MADEVSAGAEASGGGSDRDSAAIHLLARALWREQLAIPAERTDEGEAAKPDRADWKDKRRDYVRLATRLYKRLDRQGATLTGPAEAEGGSEAEEA